MQVTSEYIASVLKTLPIGYYFGKGIQLTLSDSAATSHANPITNSIEIASRNVFLALGDGATVEGTPEEVEEYVRDILYHELSHLILTGDWSKIMYSIPAHLNIFEDERIETLLHDYYHGVGFKKFTFKMNHWTPTLKPEDERQYFFHVVRFRQGPEDLVKRVNEIIAKYKDLTAVTGRYDDVRDRYYRDVERLYNDCCERFREEQAKEAMNQPTNNDSGKEQPQNDQQNGDSNDQGEDDSEQQDANDQGSSSGDGSDEDESNEDESEGNGSNDDAGEDDSDEDDSEGDGSSEDDSEQQDSSEQPNANSNDSSPSDSDSNDSQNSDSSDQNAQPSDNDNGGDDESDDAPESEADRQMQDAVDDAEQNVDNIDKLVDEMIDRDDVQKIMDNIFKNDVNKKTISDISTRMKRIITKANNKRAFQSPYSEGFTGKINPRLVAFKHDYRWMTRKNPLGTHNEGSKLHITFWVDNSGSFRSSEQQLNSLMAAIYAFEQANGTEFSYDVVTMNDRNVEHNKREMIHCNNGNCFGPNIKRLASKLNVRGNQNYNVVVWDGDLASDNKHWSESWEQYAERQKDAFNVFNNRQTIIVADTDNKQVLEAGCPLAKKTFIRRDYADEFVNETLKLLEQIMGC